MQSIEYRILFQQAQVSLQVAGTGAPHQRPRMHNLVSLFRMGSKKGFDHLFLSTRRIDILFRGRWTNRQEYLALVFECRGNWSLVQAIERQQILRSRARACSLVE